jgi:hypothetical protein
VSIDTRVTMPRTAVPIGITDPVEKARAELKAALAAIEEKANLPKRAGIALDRGIVKARAFADRSPQGAAAAAVVVAAGIGAAVWGIVRLAAR